MFCPKVATTLISAVVLLLITAEARVISQQPGLKDHPSGFMPLYKILPPIPVEIYNHQDLLPYLSSLAKREENQFDREDRDYRPLMFGKRFPDYQPPMFG